MQTQTIRYDMSVPIDVISTSCSRLNRDDNKPVPTPAIIVAKTGVLVFSLTIDKHLNKRPSLDIAYKIRGIGNKHPNKVVSRANTAPQVTIYLMIGIPMFA